MGRVKVTNRAIWMSAEMDLGGRVGFSLRLDSFIFCRILVDRWRKLYGPKIDLWAGVVVVVGCWEEAVENSIIGGWLVMACVAVSRVKSVFSRGLFRWVRSVWGR